MSRDVFGVLLLLSACASGPVERQPLADGSWHLTCRFSMTRCVREIDQVCAGRDYEILSGRAHLREYGLAALPNESATADLVVRCAEVPKPAPETDAAPSD